MCGPPIGKRMCGSPIGKWIVGKGHALSGLPTVCPRFAHGNHENMVGWGCAVLYNHAIPMGFVIILTFMIGWQMMIYICAIY